MQRQGRGEAGRAWRVVVGTVVVAGLVFGAVGAAAAGSTSAELTLIHYLTDRHDLLKEMAADYQRQTGVRVKVELYSDPAAERQKYVAAAQSGNAPEVVVSWTGIGEEMAKLVQAGYVANLTKDVAPWKDRFLPSLIEAVSFLPGNQFGVTPGVYLVPLDTNNMQMFYNTDLFARAGLGSFPATWGEFIEAGKKLRGAGIEPFTTGFGTWGQFALFDVYKFHRLGAAGVEATYRGEIPYTAPQWVEVFELFEQMRKEGILARGAATMDFPTAERLFAFGQVGILFNGSWAMGVFKYINKDFRSYAVAMPPRLERAEHPLMIPGGVGALIFVSEGPRKAEAVKFVEWLTDVPQQARYASASLNLPANRFAAGEGRLDPVLASFAAGMAHVFPTLPVFEDAKVSEAIGKGLQMILTGERSARQVAEEVQRVKAQAKRP